LFAGLAGMPSASAGLLAGLPPVSSAAFAHMARLAGPMGGHHDFIKKEEDMHKALALDERHVRHHLIFFLILAVRYFLFKKIMKFGEIKTHFVDTFGITSNKSQFFAILQSPEEASYTLIF